METVEEMEKRAQEFLKDVEKGVEKKEEVVKEELEERKKKVFSYLKKDKNLIIWGIFIIIAWFGYYIRTQNLPLLKDITTGKFIPLALDPYAFLRYAKYILDNGQLMAVDVMRYYPWGYNNLVEFKFLSFFIVYLFKFLSFFSSSITLEEVHVLYPPIAFVIGLVFFFLLVKRLLDYRVALLASLLLSIIPPYLHRTLAGFSDKEALGMVLFFAALYFFVCGWQSKSAKKSVLLGAFAGLSTGLMGLVWGGLAFLVSIIGLFGFVSFIFLKFRKKLLFSYISWYLVFYLIMMIFRNYGINNIAGSYYNAVATLALFVGLGNYLVLKYRLKNKIEDKFKLPFRFVSLLFVIILGILFIIIVMGPDLIFNQIEQIYDALTSPFGNDRWQLTVAEAHQPYLADLIGQVGWKFFWAYIVGSVILLYSILKKLDKKIRYSGLGVYILFILGFSFSRYSQSSTILNGTSFFSQKIMYFGGIFLLIISYLAYYIYSYRKDRESFKKILNIKYIIF